MQAKSLMFLRPLKKLPSKLIYKNPKPIKVSSDLNGCEVDVFSYNMLDMNKKKVVATMHAGPVLFKNQGNKLYPIEGVYKSLYISLLESIDEGCGYGSEFIKIAKLISRRSGCGGRVHLVASRVFSPDNPPHLFYRKLGFNSVSPYLDQIMDFYLWVKRPLPEEYADNLDMFLPMPKPKSQLQLKLSSMVNFFKEKFTKS